VAISYALPVKKDEALHHCPTFSLILAFMGEPHWRKHPREAMRRKISRFYDKQAVKGRDDQKGF
tara:strand:- start:299 stop:490 length:192 start_codon:yes stop_codon:yes gene_type:complete